MTIYQLRRKKTVTLTLDEAWLFFSSPKNLKFLTPEWLNFTMLEAPEDMYEGMIIIYKVSPLFHIPLTWVTEITHIDEKKFFVDAQRVGPYSLWHHEHHFKEVPGGVEVEDIVTYKLPLGPLGTLLNHLFVRRQIEAIFDYRSQQMDWLR